MENQEMQKLLTQLIQDCSKDKKALMMIKTAAVRCQNYELASKIREVENEYFPESKKQKEAKHLGERLNLAFRMVDLNISEKVCWIIAKTLKSKEKLKGNFSIKDASKILAEAAELFD